MEKQEETGMEKRMNALDFGFRIVFMIGFFPAILSWIASPFTELLGIGGLIIIAVGAIGVVSVAIFHFTWKLLHRISK